MGTSYSAAGKKPRRLGQTWGRQWLSTRPYDAVAVPRLLQFLHALVAALFIEDFLRPLRVFGLMAPQRLSLLLVAVIVIATLSRRWWLRLPLNILSLLVYAGSVPTIVSIRGTRGAPSSSHASVDGTIVSWWHQLQVIARDMAGAFQSMSSTGLPSDVQFVLGAVLLCVIFWLVLYASQRVSLWLFYNAMGLIVLLSMASVAPVDLGYPLLWLGCLAVLGLGIIQYGALVEDGSSLSVAHHPMPLQLAAGNLVPRGAKQKGYARFIGLPLLRYLGILAAMCLAATAAALWLPRPATVPAWNWQSWFPFGNHLREISGYQSSAKELGGSFTPSNQPILSVIANRPSYLRGQVYETYTGQGWLPGRQSKVQAALGQSLTAGTAEPRGFLGKLPQETNQQLISVLASGLNTNVLFSGYQPIMIRAVSGGGANKAPLYLDKTVGTLFGSNLEAGSQYELVSTEPLLPNQWLHSHRVRFPVQKRQLPASIAKADLQLPASLPANVTSLAKSLTARVTSEQGAVEQIASYLKQHETYQTTDIAKAQPGQDYVANFLFQTHKGYCNNFSSAMAVLLRASGIPTRWVTGFTQGTPDASYQGPGTQMIVRDSDAHSWVEVYYPGTGWVPVDPTPSFHMPFANGSSGSTAHPGESGVVAPGQQSAGQNPNQARSELPGQSPPATPQTGHKGSRGGKSGQAPATTPSGGGTSWFGNALIQRGIALVAAIILAAVLAFLLLRLRWRGGTASSRRAWTGFGLSSGAGRSSGSELERIVQNLLLEVSRQERSSEALNALRTRGASASAEASLASRGTAHGASTLRNIASSALQSGIPAADVIRFVRLTEAGVYGGRELSEDELDFVRNTVKVWLNALSQASTQTTMLRRGSVDEI